VISIIIPTYNESKNMPELLSAIDRVLAHAEISAYEVIVMDDDSPDRTAELVNELQIPKIRAVNRRGKPRGLAPAVMDGFREAKGDILCVMDADLSHPPEVLPMLAKAMHEGCSIAVGSRYVKGGGVLNWPLKRRLASRAACLAANLVTPVRDATSGFFMVRRSAMEGVELTPQGFKIGLEVFARANHGGKIREVPFVFKDRTRGSSKLGGIVIRQFFSQLRRLITARDRDRARVRTGAAIQP
jgi:dolichol-phosphate mannosyltransferase